MVTCIARYGWPVSWRANDTPLSKGVQHVMSIAVAKAIDHVCSMVVGKVVQQVLF